MNQSELNGAVKKEEEKKTKPHWPNLCV